jgi:hypothetical protein
VHLQRDITHRKQFYVSTIWTEREREGEPLKKIRKKRRICFGAGSFRGEAVSGMQ